MALSPRRLAIVLSLRLSLEKGERRWSFLETGCILFLKSFALGPAIEISWRPFGSLLPFGKKKKKKKTQAANDKSHQNVLSIHYHSAQQIDIALHKYTGGRKISASFRVIETFQTALVRYCGLWNLSSICWTFKLLASVLLNPSLPCRHFGCFIGRTLIVFVPHGTAINPLYHSHTRNSWYSFG